MMRALRGTLPEDGPHTRVPLPLVSRLRPSARRVDTVATEKGERMGMGGGSGQSNRRCLRGAIPAYSPPLARNVAARRSRLISLLLVACVLAAPARSRAEENPEARAIPESKESLPREFESGAQPRERSRYEARFRQARELFAKEEWIEGLRSIDEVLAEVTDPEYRRKTLLEAAKARREFEKALEKRAEEEQQRNDGFAVGIQAAVAGGPAAETAPEVGEDERSPTVEVWSADGIRYHPMALAARELLLTLPADAHDVAAQAYEAAARQALDAAAERPFSEAFAELRRIGERYPLTLSGRLAWTTLASRLADAGRFAEAAAVLDTRLRLPFPDVDDDEDVLVETRGAGELVEPSKPDLLVFSSYLHAFAGHARLARRRLETLRTLFADTPVLVRGEAVLGSSVADLPLFRELLAFSEERGTAASAWSEPAGGPRHTSPTWGKAELPEIGTELEWFHRLRPAKRFEPAKQNQQVSAWHRGSFPVFQVVQYAGQAITRSEDGLLSLDVATGEVRWRAPIDLPDVQVQRTNHLRMMRSGQPGYDDYTDLGGRSLTLCRESSLDPASEGRRLVVCLDRTAPMQLASSGQIEYLGNHILAFDARSGRRIWSFGTPDEPKSLTHGLAYTAAPTADGEVLITAALREGGYYLVGLTTSGELLWLRRLYAHTPPDTRRYGTPTRQGSPLAASEGRVFAAPGNGMITAIESATGRMLWMTRYRSDLARIQGRTSWQHTAPAIVEGADRDLLIAAPADSDWLLALDATTGEIVWEEKTSPTGQQIVGIDDERIYWTSSRDVHATRLEDGEEAWNFEDSQNTYGTGFLAADRLYLPRYQGGVLLLDAATGEELRRLRLIDRKLPNNYAFNLFPVATLEGGRAPLLHVGSAGIGSIRPQQESWEALGEDRPETRYERARLLQAEGRHDEALAIIYELLTTTRSKGLRGRLIGGLLAIVRQAARDENDASYITQLLEFADAEDRRIDALPAGDTRPEKIIKNRATWLAFRMSESEYLRKSDPEAALRAYVALLSEDGHTATSPAKNQVDVRIWASEMLRAMRFDAESFAREDEDEDEDEENEEEAAADADAETPTPLSRERADELLADEDSAARAAFDRGDQRSERTAFSRLSTRRSHTTVAAEAMARQSSEARVAGRRSEAASHLVRLIEDYPDLGDHEEIREQLASLRKKPPPVSRLPALYGASPDAAEDLLPVWRQVFWHDVEEGVLVGGAQGTSSLPLLFALRGGDLRAFGPDGLALFERPLTDYPDLEELKARLESHIEEPAEISLQGDRLVLFTAAGAYGFRLPRIANPDGGSVVDAGRFGLLWRQTWQHGLLRYSNQLSNMRGFGWGSMRNLGGGQNLFAKVDWTPEGDPVVLLTDGTLFRVNRRHGKLAWRIAPEGFSVSGRPVRRGEAIEVGTIAPPGRLRYLLPGDDDRQTKTGRRGGSWSFRSGPENQTRLASAEGIADAASIGTGKIEVRAASTGRVLWTRNTSSSLVTMTPNEVWTTGSGNLKARSLRNGRELRRIPLPESTRVQHVFDPPEVSIAATQADEPTLVCSKSSRVHYNPYGQRSQTTGVDLWLVRVDPEYREVRWKHQLAKGSVSYHGERWHLQDGRWLLPFNVQKEEGERWVTRVVAFDPSTRAQETWVEVEISGKGTGQTPRICPLEDGLAVGNSDGFGWFTRSAPPEDEPDGDAGAAEEED